VTRDNRPDGSINFGDSLQGRIARGVVYLFAISYVLFSDYPALAVPAIVALFFAAYVWLRVMVWMETNSFTPGGLQVGLTWALVGIDRTTQEHDIRPVRVYFILLSLLFAALVLRPIIAWITL